MDTRAKSFGTAVLIQVSTEIVLILLPLHKCYVHPCGSQVK